MVSDVDDDDGGGGSLLHRAASTQTSNSLATVQWERYSILFSHFSILPFSYFTLEAPLKPPPLLYISHLLLSTSISSFYYIRTQHVNGARGGGGGTFH